MCSRTMLRDAQNSTSQCLSFYSDTTIPTKRINIYSRHVSSVCIIQAHREKEIRYIIDQMNGKRNNTYYTGASNMLLDCWVTHKEFNRRKVHSRRKLWLESFSGSFDHPSSALNAGFSSTKKYNNTFFKKWPEAEVCLVV